MTVRISSFLWHTLARGPLWGKPASIPREAKRWVTSRRTSFAVLLLLLFVPLLILPAHAVSKEIGHEFLPPYHWSYFALARFEALGFCILPSERRFTRDEVIQYVSEIKEGIAASKATLHGRDKFNLDRLEQEFFDSESQANPKARFDPPVLYASDGSLHFEFDIDLGAAARDTTQWDFFGVSNPTLRLHITDSWTYELRYRIVMGPERDGRERGAYPSTRERSWRGLTSLYERSYLAYYRGWGNLFLGRDYVDWGPAGDRNVILAKEAGSQDLLGGRIRFKNFRLDAIHVILSSTDERYLSGHRLQMMVGKLVLGLSETVIHRDRLLDPAYLLPFASFYANQYAERGDDNVLWAIDAKYRVTNGLVVDGSLLIDDFQYERGDSAADSYAFNVGVRGALARPLPADLDVRYRHVTMYTYTHRDSLNYHVGGSGNPNVGEPILGVTEGPDADLLTASVDVFPLPRLTTSLLFASLRRGEGNGFRAFEPGDDPSPRFPSGVVERTTSLKLRVVWAFDGNSHASAEIARALIENENHVPGADVWRTSLRFIVRWNFK
ncbi:MAG: hypothetical protein GTO29_08630 [Candidatus Latescibacteria bacterium]|nr:hypothetical protein [Candidatus Latescibacterota bacterium]NIO56229.1 hypothetical protein [Candidatus Latescibacterota bacterium]